METKGFAYDIMAMADGGDYLWAIAGGSFQLLMKIYKEDFHVEYVSSFRKEGLLLYQQILVHEEKLYFVPRSADHLAFYDIKKDIWKSIPIVEPDRQKNGLPYYASQKFRFGEVYKNQIYLFPCHYPAIGILDIEKEEITYLYDMFPSQTDEPVWEGQAFAQKAGRNGNKVMIHSPHFGLLYEFNLDTFHIQVISRIPMKNMVKTVAYDGKYFYSVPSVNSIPIRKWSREGEETVVADLSGIEYEISPFYLWTFFQGLVWIFPGLADSVLCIDISANTAKRAKSELLRFPKQSGEAMVWKYPCICNCGNALFAFDRTDCTLVRIEGEEVKKIQLQFDCREYTKIEMALICQMEPAAPKSEWSEESIGEKIYGSVCSES